MRIQKNTRRVVLAGMTAAVYIALVLLNVGYSFGPWQFRVAEILTVLPFLFPETIPGLFVGCLIANLLGPSFGPPDVIFGSLATLTAACLTARCKTVWLAPVPPVVINGLVVGGVITLCDPAIQASPVTFLVVAGQIAVCQLAVCAGLGLPLLAFLQKVKIREKLRLEPLIKSPRR